LDAATVAIELTPSAAYAPFQAVALQSVFVDGKSWIGPAIDVVYNAGIPSSPEKFDAMTLFTVCGSTTVSGRGLTPGKHIVEVRATIPGTSNALTAASTEVDLECPP